MNNLKGELLEDGFCINCGVESGSEVCTECQYDDHAEFDYHFTDAGYEEE